MNRIALLFIFVSTGIILLAACSGPESTPTLVATSTPVGTPTPVPTPTPDATQTALDDLAVRLSVPEYALAKFTDEDIAYAQELIRVRTLTERDPSRLDCYSDTLTSGIRYYRDVIDLPSHSLELDIPIGWTAISSIDGDRRLSGFAETPDASVTRIRMAQNCEAFRRVEHLRQGGTHISIMSRATRDALEWLNDETGETWNTERTSQQRPDIEVTLLDVGTIEIPDRGAGITAVESIELGANHLLSTCCNDTRPHHYAFIEVDDTLYGFHMFETEGPLSIEAFTHMLQSMKFTLKPE